MSWLPLAIGAAVLVVAGTAKLSRPEPFAATLSRLSLPWGVTASRGVGATEVVVGIAALLWSSPLVASLVAGFYLVFAGVIGLLLRRRDPTPCGCFGANRAGPSRVHLGVYLALAAGAALAALTGAPALLDALAADTVVALAQCGAVLGAAAAVMWSGERAPRAT